MRQELRETSVYNTILESIALGNTKLNDIFQKTQIEKTFEEICISYMRRENKDNKLPLYFTKIGRQWKADFDGDEKVHFVGLSDILSKCAPKSQSCFSGHPAWND